MESDFFEMSAIAREEGRKYVKKRFAYGVVERHLHERVFLALVGPRGAGKTVMLKQLLSQTESSFYLSLDTEKPEEGLFNAAKELSSKGVKILLLDEVHAFPGFEKELKKIYDFLPTNVVFTSSSALSLHETAYDMSRRARIVQVPPFSFREFLYFNKEKLYSPITFNQLIEKEEARSYYGKTIEAESHFDVFLQGFNYPFTAGKTNVIPLFKNILETILNNDLTSTGRAAPEETLEIRRMLSFIGKTPAEDTSYSSIAKNTGITKYKAEKYVGLMEKAFVLRRVMPTGANVLREPKILFTPPYRLAYKDYGDCIGALREDFFTDAMANAGQEVNYLKTTRGRKTPDYAVGDTVFEIGGASKTTVQFKGVNYAKQIILTHPGTLDDNKRPLYFTGMLEQNG